MGVVFRQMRDGPPSNIDWDSGEKVSLQIKLSSKLLSFKNGGCEGVGSDIDSICKICSYRFLAS